MYDEDIIHNTWDTTWWTKRNHTHGRNNHTKQHQSIMFMTWSIVDKVDSGAYEWLWCSSTCNKLPAAIQIRCSTHEITYRKKANSIIRWTWRWAIGLSSKSRNNQANHKSTANKTNVWQKFYNLNKRWSLKMRKTMIITTAGLWGERKDKQTNSKTRQYK